MKREFFIIFALIALCGCGYTTRSVLSSNSPSIYVDNFTNKINVTLEASKEKTYYAYRPALESDITREVINRFIFDGNYRIKGPESARFSLKGELVDFTREPLRYDANENIAEYRISVVVDMELHDPKGEGLIWQEKRFAGESTYRTTGQLAKSENTAVTEAVEDLARRIVERTVENW
jgi:hypothetical protein